MYSKDDIKRLSVKKAKAKAVARDQGVENWVAEFMNTEHALSNKQKKGRLRRLQLELPLDVPACFRSDNEGPKSRKR